MYDGALLLEKREQSVSGSGASHLCPNSPSGNFRYARNVIRNRLRDIKIFKAREVKKW